MVYGWLFLVVYGRGIFRGFPDKGFADLCVVVIGVYGRLLLVVYGWGFLVGLRGSGFCGLLLGSFW